MLGSFQFFWDILKSRFAMLSTTTVANFATGTVGVVDTGGKFATDVMDIKLPPEFATGVKDTGGK